MTRAQVHEGFARLGILLAYAIEITLVLIAFALWSSEPHWAAYLVCLGLSFALPLGYGITESIAWVICGFLKDDGVVRSREAYLRAEIAIMGHWVWGAPIFAFHAYSDALTAWVVPYLAPWVGQAIKENPDGNTAFWMQTVWFILAYAIALLFHWIVTLESRQALEWIEDRRARES